MQAGLLIPGYELVLLAAHVSPPEIVGLAEDSGGVTTIVTVQVESLVVEPQHPHDAYGLLSCSGLLPMNDILARLIGELT